MTNYQQKQKTLRDKKLAIKKLLLSTAFRISLIVLILILGVVYLLQTTFLSTKGYEITELDKKIENLEQENQKLEFEIASNSSMKNIQERLQNSNMVAVNNVEYITLLGNTVALK